MSTIYYAALMDGTDYGTLEDYLDNPITPIDYILHVRDPRDVPVLAEKIDGIIEQGGPALKHLKELVVPWIEQGDLLITTRRAMLLPAHAMVESHLIKKDTLCFVIYLPPFYISHTAGLFEFIQNKPEEKMKPPKPRALMKP